MKFLAIPIIVYIINTLIKSWFLWINKRPVYGGEVLWNFLWVGQFPSSHAAVLASCLTLVYMENGLSPIFAFCCFVGYMLLYGFLEDKKRQKLYEGYFSKSSDAALKQIGTDKILMDFSGHNLPDLAFGLVEGFLITFLLTRIF